MSEINKNGSSIIVKLDIDLVASTAFNIKAELKTIVEKDAPSELVIDLDEVQMVDSAGLGVLLSTYNSLEKTEGKLKIMGLQQN